MAKAEPETRRGEGEGKEEENKIEKKYQEADKLINALTADSMFSFIQSSWTIIGNMQQSAGILLTILSLIMTICVGNVFSNLAEKYESDEKIVICLILIISLAFLTIAFVYLFKIILPKKIKNQIKDFSSLNKVLLKKLQKYNSAEGDDFETIITKLYIDIFSNMNRDLQKLIKKNQKSYSICIAYAITSFICNMFFILLILLKYILTEIGSMLLYIYVILFCFAILVAIFRLLIFRRIEEV